MLTITLRDDGGLTLVSDDRDAENARVGDCFSGGVADEGWESDDFEGDALVDYEVISAWENAPFTDGKLEVSFPAEHTKDILEALSSQFYQADDLLAEIESTQVERSPKPR